MAPPAVSHFTLTEVCDRWGMKLPHVGALVLQSKLRVSVGLGGAWAEFGYWEEVDTDHWERIPEERRFLVGIYELLPRDGWTVIKNGQHDVREFWTLKPNYLHLTPDGVAIIVSEVLVSRDEVERFEAENGVSDAAETRNGNVRGGPGRPSRYEWDAFWVETCRRVHEDGVPDSQAEMVRGMIDWFNERGGAVPDESTVKKKMSQLWRSIRSSEGQLRAVGGSRPRNSVPAM